MANEPAEHRAQHSNPADDIHLNECARGLQTLPGTMMPSAHRVLINTQNSSLFSTITLMATGRRQFSEKRPESVYM